MRLQYPFLIFSLLLYLPVADLMGQANFSTDLSYDVSMIEPELIGQYQNIRHVIIDRHQNIWFGNYTGLSCYDGQRLITYNTDVNDTIFKISKEGFGFRELVTVDSVHLWMEEFETHDIVCFDMEQRRQVKRIKRAPVDFDFLSAHDGDIYSIYRSKGTEYISMKSLIKDTTEIKVYGIAGIVNSYKYFADEHWLRTDRDSMYRIDKGGKIRERYAIGGELNFLMESEDLLYFQQTTKSIAKRIKAGQDSIETFLEIPKSFRDKAHRFMPYGDEVWCFDFLRDVKLYRPKDGLIEDYTQTINALVTRLAPNTLKSFFNYVYPLSNGDFILIGPNSIIRFTKKYPDDSYFRESISSGSSICSMRGLAEDNDGNIYAAYYTGVSVKRKDANQFVEFEDTQRAKKNKPNSYSLTVSDEHLFWDHSYFNLDDGTRRLYHYENYGSHTNHVLTQDTMWMFFWFNNLLANVALSDMNYQVVSPKFYDAPLVVSDVIMDKSGDHFYVATDLDGILKINKKGDLIERISDESLGLPYDRDMIYALELRGDSLWFGNQLGLGLLDLDNGQDTIFHFPMIGADGSPIDRYAYIIQSDDKGNFYIGSNYGLLYFDTKSITFYGLPDSHPLSNKEYNRNSSLRDADGKYYMGTIDGLYSFYPDELPLEPLIEYVPRPIITQISIQNQEEKKNRHICSGLNDDFQLSLLPNDYSFKIDFSSNHFGDQVYYSTRIREFGEQWSAYSTNNYLENYSLTPGEYTLDINGSLNANYPVKGYATIKIVKRQVWYKRWWALLLFAMAGTGIVAYALRYRYRQQIKRQKDMEQLRTKISSDLHDDVGSILTGLAMQSEIMALEATQEQKESLEEMAVMSRDAMGRMRDTVWAIDSRKDNYKNLISRIHSFAESSFSKKNIAYNFDVQNLDVTQSINPDIRQGIYLIAKEAIANIIKHSDATEVQIQLDGIGKGLRLVVRDNGTHQIEISMLHKSAGMGLSNMKMRAENMGGTLHYSSDRGFALKLIVPKGNN